MKFFIKDFFSKDNQIRSFLRIFLHLLRKSLMINFSFWAVNIMQRSSRLEMFYNKGALRNVCKIRKKATVPESLFQ